MNIYMNKIIHVYAIGDLHGDHRAVRDFVQRNIQLHKNIANGDENILICLGDFGGNYFCNHRDEEFKKKFGQKNEHCGNLNFIIKKVINVIM